MKTRVWIFLIGLIMLLTPVISMADMGPKPSIEIEFTGVDSEGYYGTILIDGMGIAGMNTDNYEQSPELLPDCYGKFKEYAAHESLNFFGYTDDIDGDENVFYFGYMAPVVFEPLIYIPETDEIISCGVCERKHFEAKYTYDVNTGVMTDVTLDIFFKREIPKAALRLVLTCAIELLVAGIFLLWQKKLIATILITNIGTQLLLNISLMVEELNEGGGLGYLVLYIFLEFIIFIVEGTVYKITFKKLNQKHRKLYPILYALTANAASLVLGFLVIR